jgi:hypothetical protein
LKLGNWIFGGSETGTVTEFCELGNENLGAVKGGKTFVS